MEDMNDEKSLANETLFDRVAAILEQARGNVVRAVNSNMVLANWLIGREIVQELQGGEERAENCPRDFLHSFPGSHYRALMRVENAAARDFYEREAIACGWSKTQLERQIHSFYYDRIIANRGEKGLLPEGRERLPGETVQPSHLLTSPMVLEFLGLPDSPGLHESKLEQAIIDNLQHFLLELGKGFSFVARQKHIRFEDDDFYIDLVFYNYVLKCFLLIDLKMGKLSHADIGQMDGYVRLYEDQFKIPGDNPTIGLLLCADKSEAVAKYSILSENRHIFATKYLPNLPSEEQLRREITRERRLIEEAMREQASLLDETGVGDGD